MDNRRIFLFIPPVRRPTGGITVLYQAARLLRRIGFDARLALREPPLWAPQVEDVPAVDFSDLALTSADVWLVPEGWGNALAPGLAAGARCVVYVQNWAYLFSGLPGGVDWRRLPVEFLAVSWPVAWFIEQSLGRPAAILRPGIDLDVFAPAAAKPERLTVAFMPRKNKALAEQMRAVLKARGRFDVRFLEIAGMDQAQVAAALAQSHVFAATGFPEGCPLPPLEAMASGAIPVGFAGLGGFDYMRQAEPGGYAPALPLNPAPFGGNGFYAADGDVMGLVFALEKALALWRAGGEPLARVLGAGQDTARAYSLHAQEQALRQLDLFKPHEPAGASPA